MKSLNVMMKMIGWRLSLWTENLPLHLLPRSYAIHLSCCHEWYNSISSKRNTRLTRCHAKVFFCRRPARLKSDVSLLKFLVMETNNSSLPLMSSWTSAKSFRLLLFTLSSRVRHVTDPHQVSGHVRRTINHKVSKLGDAKNASRNTRIQRWHCIMPVIGMTTAKRSTISISNVSPKKEC